MKVNCSKVASNPESRAQRKLLTNSITLIALGVSILFLNSWDNLFVKASIGLFWGAYFLILNGPDVFKTLRNLARNNDSRHASYELSSQR
jgi:ABC-type transport system involved in cytochrome bd biosynthesis fused ATPase/permease subunit